MPLRLDIKRKLTARSDRVKSCDLHPTEQWMLVSLYNGNVHIWNHESQQLVKSFEVCELPVRAAIFVPRKNWVVTGSDDMQVRVLHDGHLNIKDQYCNCILLKVRVFNYNTLERQHAFDAHSDYVRSIAAHPTQPFILTSSGKIRFLQSFLLIVSLIKSPFLRRYVNQALELGEELGMSAGL